MSVTRQEPVQPGPGAIELANRPFHELATRHPALGCELNVHPLNGTLCALGEPAGARLDPAPDRCCVPIRRA